MDQPDTRDENEIPTTPQDDASQQDVTSDSATPINVTIQTDDATSDEVTDSVMDGVPSANDVTPSGPSEMPDMSTAEEAVDEALPQSTDEELAAVASELENIAASDAPMDESPTDTQTPSIPDNDNDPMRQIMQDAEAESMPPADAESYPSATEQTTDTDIESMTEPAGDSQSEPDSSTESMGSMETENEYGVESVQQDTQSEQTESAEDPQDHQVVQETMSEPYDESPTMSDSGEEIAGGSNEPAVTSETSDADQTADIPVADAPSYSAPLTEESSEEVAEESPAEHSETNDVVTPSIVAAAVAAGTSGDNAITGTPESTPTAQAQETPKQGGSTERKSGKGMIIAVVAMVTLLFGGGAVAAYMMQPEQTEDVVASELMDEDTAEDNESEQIDDTALPGEKVVARTLDDYKAACSGGGMVTNADSYNGDGPHPLVVFEKGSDDKYAQSLVNFKDTSWSAKATDVTSGQLVACIARKADSEVKLKDCPITDSVTKVTVDVPFYSSSYTVDLFVAQTGAKVSSFENKSISTTCPTNVAYDKNDPKIFAGFDQIDLETSLTVPVTAEL